MLRPPGTSPPRFGDTPLLADRYRIERELGRGGMAVVHLAYDTRHERQVAIKFISDEIGNVVGTQRFLQEIRLTASLQHPHVLPVYDSGVTPDNVLYYVMPYVAGGSLRARLEGGTLPIPDVVRVAREVADALAYAHQRGIVHRDVKPENILFSEGHALVADFGIARLATTGTAQQLTVQGVVVGTPAYMSPEQAFAGTVDNRADVYSLACVVYEMLTGKVPFNSPAAGTWTQFGLSRIPPSIRGDRAEVPAAMEEELVRALAPSPDDRHAGTRELAQALERAATQPASPLPLTATGVRRRARRAWRGGLLVGASLALVALTSVAFFPTPVRDRLVMLGMIELDATRAILPPVQGVAGTDSLARLADRALRAELARWSGLRLVSDETTRDVTGGGDSLTLNGAISAARQSRAAMLLWTRVRLDGARPVVEAQHYDARSATSVVTATAAAPATDSVWGSWARLTASTLLGGADLPSAALRAAGATRSLPAWRAFVRGHRALEVWGLPAADSAFAEAVTHDPRFSAARVWLAQVLVWTRRSQVSDWRRHADESLMLAGTLDPVERSMAQAIGALGRRDAARACQAFGGLVARDSLDARAWLGLGDCHAMDDAVVREPRSPTGHAFRGNFTAAMAAYERAVRLSPRAHAALPLAFVERLIPTQVDRFRAGVASWDTTVVFAARPTPSGDSVVYLPRPLVNNALPDDPAGFEEALHRNRIRMLEYVLAWTQRMPADRDAYEALASVQEARGELTGDAAGGRLSALVALDTAQRLASDAEARARVAASRVRVLIKAGEFERARALADSLLSRGTGGAKEAFWLAGVAAVTGRAREAARLARLGAAEPVAGWDTLPAPVGQAATLFLVQAAAGVCDDGFRASVGRMDELIESYGVPAHRAAIRAALTNRARRLAVPCLGVAQISGLTGRSPWDRMQQRLADNDARGVRAVFDTLQESRRNRRPGGTAVDFTFMGAWLLAAVGDTAGAVRHLDLTLNALPTLNLNAVKELAQSSALVRTMAWRADLALALGDVQNATRWGSAASTLWKNADPELQPSVQRMRKLAGR